jgi:Sensors of blue-light using FAD
MPAVDQIAYCSLCSVHALSLGMIDSFQAAQNITGVLLFHDQLTIHWLEGDAQSVQRLWEDVQNDPQQHGLVRLLHRKNSPKRLFTHWRMRASSRQDMIVIVREARAQARRIGEVDEDEDALPWLHAISTLNILLDPEFTRMYAEQARPKLLLEGMARNMAFSLQRGASM